MKAVAVVWDFEIVLIGEVVGVPAALSSRAAGVAGNEIAHVGEAGGRGAGGMTNNAAGVRAGRGAAGTRVEQGTGRRGAGGG